MSGMQLNEPGSYDLPLCSAGNGPGQAPTADSVENLPGSIALENAQWYCRLRWFAALATCAAGGVGVLGWPDSRPAIWPWMFALAGALAAGNAGFLLHIKRFCSPERAAVSLWNLRGQVLLDLTIITVAAVVAGPQQTAIAFSYLLCIVLGCVFFPRRQSLGLAVIAGTIYGTCVIAEWAGFLQPATLGGRAPGLLMGAAGWADVIPTVGMWLTVWYLVSHLSSMGRRRGIELAQANRRLLAVQKERQRHMLTTTHQLKAPFAAIHANTQVLLGGYCGELPEQATQVIGRIAARCRRLATEIQEMLELANLSSPGQHAAAPTDLNLAALLEWCVEQLEPLAGKQDVVFHKDLHWAQGRGIEEHFRVMFLNLLSNSVNYSHKGGKVSLTCRPDAAGGAIVTVRDEGIGIAPEKLPRIFDEYYRTNEAVQHNRESSGLGLAIVRHVAELHGIRVRVQSVPDRGSTFELRFPSGSSSFGGT